MQSSGRASVPSTEGTLKTLAEIEDRLRAYLTVAVPHGEERAEIQREAVCEAWICLTTQDKAAAAPVEALRVARRLAARWKRQQRAESGNMCEDFATESGAPNEATQRYRLALWEYEDQILLAHLTVGQRAALEMHVMDDLSDGEIADIAALRQSALRALRHTAKGRLRQLIRNGEIPLPPTVDE
jgi:DNA-directed RNA polymerase specialized sigma24 family protein